MGPEMLDCLKNNIRDFKNNDFISNRSNGKKLRTRFIQIYLKIFYSFTCLQMQQNIKNRFVQNLLYIFHRTRFIMKSMYSTIKGREIYHTIFLYYRQ